MRKYPTHTGLTLDFLCWHWGLFPAPPSGPGRKSDPKPSPNCLAWGRIWAPDRLVGPEKVPDANKGNRGKDPCGWGICAFWDKDVKILQRAGPGLGRNVCVILDYPSSSSFRISWSCSLHSKISPQMGGVRWPFSRLHMVPGPESAIGRSKLHFRIFEEVEDRMFVVKQ